MARNKYLREIYIDSTLFELTEGEQEHQDCFIEAFTGFLLLLSYYFKNNILVLYPEQMNCFKKTVRCEPISIELNGNIDYFNSIADKVGEYNGTYIYNGAIDNGRHYKVGVDTYYIFFSLSLDSYKHKFYRMCFSKIRSLCKFVI